LLQHCQSVLKISRNTTVILQWSVGRIIHDRFTAIHLPKGKQCAYLVASVAT